MKYFLFICIFSSSCTYIQVEGSNNSVILDERIDAEVEAEKK